MDLNGKYYVDRILYFCGPDEETWNWEKILLRETRDWENQQHEREPLSDDLDASSFYPSASKGLVCKVLSQENTESRRAREHMYRT